MKSLPNIDYGMLKQAKKVVAEGERSDSDKLAEAIRLLWEVSENWDNDAVRNYPKGLPSFDELISTMQEIEIDR